MVNEAVRAWHAGFGGWREIKADMNTYAIGIEIVNTGDEPFNDIQVLTHV